MECLSVVHNALMIKVKFFCSFYILSYIVYDHITQRKIDNFNYRFVLANRASDRSFLTRKRKTERKYLDNEEYSVS